MKIKIQKVWAKQTKKVNGRDMTIQNIDAMGEDFKEIRISAWNKQQEFAEFDGKLIEIEGLKFSEQYNGKDQYKLEDKYSIKVGGVQMNPPQDKPQAPQSLPQTKATQQSGQKDQLDVIQDLLARMSNWGLSEENKVKIAITVSISQLKNK